MLITDELAFKNAMTRDYKGVQELSIMSEGITFIDSGNHVLKQMVALKKLDLSFNKIARIDNLEGLRDLRELILSYNRLEEIHANIGKIQNLRVINLNHNKIRRIENLKTCRKLEVLQISGNLLEDLSVYGGG